MQRVWDEDTSTAWEKMGSRCKLLMYIYNRFASRLPLPLGTSLRESFQAHKTSRILSSPCCLLLAAAVDMLAGRTPYDTGEVKSKRALPKNGFKGRRSPATFSRNSLAGFLIPCCISRLTIFHQYAVAPATCIHVGANQFLSGSTLFTAQH